MRRVLASIAAIVLLASSVSPTAAAGPTTPITVGTQGSTAGLNALMDYCAQRTGQTVAINDGQFQVGTIQSYLEGTPDTIVAWNASERMRFYANQGLLKPINDVWNQVGTRYSSYLRSISTDGRKQYFVPVIQYSWVVIYRKSLFAKMGYQVPKTLNQFVALANRMQTDGLIPLASADADGWEAMGMFDILDMRMNGYAFHMRLMAGRERWTDQRVAAVFRKWAQLLPYFQTDAASRTWQQGMQPLVDETAGMYFAGTFAAYAVDSSVVDDLGMFAFPRFGNRFDGERAIDAPVEGLVLSTSDGNLGGAKRILKCAATRGAQLAYTDADPLAGVATVKNADTSGYTTYQKEISQTIRASGKMAQFLDRDSRPDFTGPNGMQAFLADFLVHPNQNLHAYLAAIQGFWDALPPQ